MLSYDASAIALSFVPAAEEDGRYDDAYTYHHLRKDIFGLCKETGVEIGSRYIVPSAHLTIGRFVTQTDFSRIDNDGGATSQLDGERLLSWVNLIEELNLWLQQEFWPVEDSSIPKGGEWFVGAEKGLECRRDRVWYGGGTSLRVGKGF